MEKFSLKSLLTIVVILLIGIVAIWRINQGPKKVEAGWWNESWSYRKAITLTNSGTGQTDVYVAITIDTSDTTRFQADGGDIRFTKQNGELLPYYIVSGAGTASTVVHINFDIYPAGDSTFYLYYGNSNADNGFSVSDFTTQASNSSTNLLDEELSPAPIAYWSFNEGTGTTVYDSTSNQKHGVLFVGNSAPSWQNQENCISGKCLYFDGNDSIETSLDSSWNQNNSVSWSFWIKPSSTASNAGILGKKYPSWEWAFYQDGNQLNLVYWNSSGGHTNGMDDGWGSVLQVGQWSHIVYTWDGSVSRFYANGKLVNSHTATNPSINQDRTNNVMIGGNIYVWADKYFNGYLDEIKSYPYARTANQIKQDYNAGLAGISSMEGGSVNVGGTQVRNIKDHLVAHYKFDEGYGNTVNNFSSLGTTLNGTLGSGNSAPTWTTGKNNKGLLFDGDDYIDLPNDLTYTDEVSAFAWFKSLGDPPGGYHIIFGGSQLEISIPSSGQIRTGINTSARYVSNHGSGITDGNWHYVGFTFDGSTKNSYIDGEYVGQQTGIEGALVNSFSSRRIGRFGSSSTYFANGLIDEVKIYNTALSDAEIKLDYNQGSQFVMGQSNQTIGGTTTSLEYCIPGDTTHCAPPIAEYKFDEGIGTSAFDTSGNNNNGVLVNSPSWTIGKIGKSLSFGTTASYVNIPTISPAITGQQLTISGWFNINVFSGVQRLISVSNAYPNFGLSSTSLYVHTTTTNGNDVNIPYFTLPTTCQTGWHHLSLTWNTALSSDNINVYCDGKNIGKGTLINSINGNLNVNSLWIGHNTASYLGKIDQVRIYNYARTPAQIAYDYNKGAPVGWWKFDECEGTTINDWAAPPAGGANHGTLTIGVGGSQSTVGTCQSSGAWYNGKDGKTNSAMSFDGVDDKVDIADNDIFNFSGKSAAISLWVKASDNPGKGILEHWTGGTPGAGWNFWTQANGKISFEHRASSNNINLTSISRYDDLSWHHLLVTINNTNNNASLYFDGQLEVTDNFSGLIDQVENFHIGMGYTTGYYFNGLIDDVRIYNYALTSEQVKQIYNGGAVNFR